MSTTSPPVQQLLICRRNGQRGYYCYQLDLEAQELWVELSHIKGHDFPPNQQLAQIGGYLLQWGPRCEHQGDPSYAYKLLAFDPSSDDPLSVEPLQTGFWKQEKFWGYRDYYSDNPEEGTTLDLIPMGSFVLNVIPAKGRGTYQLWNFDPCPTAPLSQDPLPAPYTPQGGFPLIKAGHQLLPIGNYVIDRLPDGCHFRLWSFDPQSQPPLAMPYIHEGYWPDIDAARQLTVVGDHVLDWHPEERDYRLWRFDPEDDQLLVGPIRSGTLPEGISKGSVLTSFQPSTPINQASAQVPGTLDFMRSTIKHVVYYMVESRSFDNVCGWLYQQGEQDCHFVGSDAPFDGASYNDYNLHGDKKVPVSQFRDGKLSEQWDLKAVNEDPFHDTTDALQQMFIEPDGYWQRQTPDMGGFILNSANPQVMETFSPQQLPILNGLAKHFAISDRWFSAIPGGTDVNRAFSVTGSAFNKLGTWEGGDPYKYWPFTPHRQSLWKLLWSQGITDWKIYYSILWEDAVFTDQLYLQGQIPTVDANKSEYLANLSRFKTDAATGQLPAFSYIEPAWIAPTGATSYHPGADLVPAERALNDIYQALKNGPNWEQTLLVITFDKNNGLYDHAIPPYAKKPWPHDHNNGFNYDLMGPRVPTIMVSPWIKPQTVIRSGQHTPFDATSFAATLLQWFGIPKSLWALGERMANAPTFEAVLQQPKARMDSPELIPPYDKTYPRSASAPSMSTS